MRFIRPAHVAWIVATVLMSSMIFMTQTASAQGDADTSTTVSPSTLPEWFDHVLTKITKLVETALFFDISGGFLGDDKKLPFLIMLLAGGAIFFTCWHGFINIRGFRHAVQIVMGKYSKIDDPGEITPFRALTSALSATVGLGNIAGVSIAMVLGGPGALFWMMVLGLFGMASKFHESTLGQMYRRRNPDGSYSGGAMYYLDDGFRSIHPALGGVGKVLAVMFAVFCMGAALGGGNMFQANQAFEGFYSMFVAEAPLTDAQKSLMTEQQLTAEAERRDSIKERTSIGFGLMMATIVAVVVIGGITRIGATTCRIVPVMVLIYLAACVTILVVNITTLPALIGEVFAHAFKWDSAWGGFIGVLVMGFQRAAFSSEAGIGSSAIAHSAAQTREPVREGLVASLEPFIDTIVICFMTGMVVLITRAYLVFPEGADGSAVTLYAFQQKPYLASWFPYILSISIVLFAFSTMIAWCYYGERSWSYLFGVKSVIIFRLVFVACVFIGSVASLSAVLKFADALLLSMALPNIIGGIVLAPQVKRELQQYWRRYKAGEFDEAEAAMSADKDAGDGI